MVGENCLKTMEKAMDQRAIKEGASRGVALFTCSETSSSRSLRDATEVRAWGKLSSSLWIGRTSRYNNDVEINVVVDG